MPLQSCLSPAAPILRALNFSEHKCHLLVSLLCLCKGYSSDWNVVSTLGSLLLTPHMCVPPESPLCPSRLLQTFVSIPWASSMPDCTTIPELIHLTVRCLWQGTHLSHWKQGPRLSPPACPTELVQYVRFYSGSLIRSANPVAQHRLGNSDE